MAYVPPKYPSEIPTIIDLPNRSDDTDWATAGRYNEIKKELRAALTELGVLPKGAFADVKARLNDIYPQFHDRGDPSTYDWTDADLTTDGTWRDLDLSSIVPAGAKAVLLRVQAKDDVEQIILRFRKKGNTNDVNVAIMGVHIANVTMQNNLIVNCDANRIIQYNAANYDWTFIYISVGGWWK